MSASKFVRGEGQGLTFPLCLSDVVNDVHFQRRAELREQFAGQNPFSFILIDDFLKPQIAAALADEYPPLREMAKIFREPWAYKGQLSDIERRQPIVSTFQSDQFRDFMSDLTGIPDLISDPVLAGAGFHQFPNRGFQDPHVDPNYHPFDKRLHRRLNFFVYLTREWHKEWGGELEMWEERNGKPFKQTERIEPRFNRAVLFYSSRHSWHSVSKVTCPEGITRKSLAITLYTSTRPGSEIYRDSSAIWHSPRSPIKRLMYPVANAAIALLKPHAALLRRFRPNVFDASSRFDPGLAHDEGAALTNVEADFEGSGRSDRISKGGPAGPR